MEPRELWERHAVLAQAFCSSDDEVRRAQRLLDEAQAGRSRTLAAFAVTVGSDEAVAELLGLQGREVRVARRTVGKEDARTVARNLLAQPPEEHSAAPRAAPEEPVVECPPEYRAPEYRVPEETAPQPEGVAAAPPFPAAPSPGMAPANDHLWSPALDAVLVGGWHAGVDLSVLAVELGLDLAHLVARAQSLSAEGRLTPQMHQDRSGRHRRAEGPGSAPTQPEHQAQQWPDAEQYDNHTAWQQYPPPATLPSHDWDGILSQWEHASAAPQHTGSWEHYTS